ncbi:hypothetical protein GXW82_34015 [Streptacidiphilus sp. 4-A2]|nr:hypothetical protein [Streptacidiphilus sp. 4-A2]
MPPIRRVRHRGRRLVRLLPVALLLPALALVGLVPPQAAAARRGDFPGLPGLPGLVGSQQLVSNGDPARRITIVLLGDGYTAAELPATAARRPRSGGR